ncbi:sigma 54-interacting transcriptional regulator [Pseudomonas aeruginosa]|nr:sigma 54-interacting transcriptional regulator [Pseudomonas aeruginosa]
MPVNLQIKLLRVLQEHTLERLGSRPVDPGGLPGDRGDQADLAAMGKSGQFRSDLYYRLNVVAWNCRRCAAAARTSCCSSNTSSSSPRCASTAPRRNSTVPPWPADGPTGRATYANCAASPATPSACRCSTRAARPYRPAARAAPKRSGEAFGRPCSATPWPATTAT